ncbi:phage tail spike protein [Bacillus sp. FDAARGOS_235]|uniref:phage tail spike protein n=1 Tax=Bacillus sp. FDAARGOS_235 TaxID=1839798 RepID=UPI0011A4C2FB|nr:phage tail spike protein [Bacillus sp. FDAARGOS_235]
MSKTNNLLHIVDFKTEQIIGVIKEQDYWDDLRQWELKDNKDKFEFTTADGTKIAASLTQQNLVVKQTRDGTFVSYIITEVEQDSTGRPKKIYALGEHTKLKKATVIKPQTLQATTVNESTDFALQGTEWKRGITEFVGIRTIHIKDFTNPLDLLKQIASTFELEIRFRTEIMGSFIVGRYVDLIKKVGRDNGKEFLLGKDVQGIRRIENSQDVVTALVGVGPQNSETGEFLTFEEINNGKLYVGNNDALQRWSKDGKHLFDMYSPQTEDQDMTKQRLKQLTEAELKKRIDSSTSYEVSAVALEKVFGLSHESVRKGDTVRIKDTGFSPPLFLEARLIAADECDTDPSKDKYIFGNYREIKDTRSPIDRLYAQIMGSLSNKASKELLDMLDKKLQENVKETEVIRKESEAAKKIAEQAAENLKNNTVDIIEGVNPPTENLKDRKTLWQDISKGKPGILKLWKDGKWDPVVPDVESVKKETLEQVSKDIETTKSELNQKVQEAQKQATGQFNEVKESLQGVSRTISDVQNKQGEIDKKVTRFEQDSNGFKLSIESLTKKNTDISNKINTVEQTVEGTKKTISDVQQTATDLKKTTTEIKEQAGKISEKLTTVETKVNNDKAGGRNLLLDSNVKYEKTDYLINQYSLTENFSTGEEYTFVIKGSVLQGQKFGIWQNGGSNNVGYATSVYANGITYVTFKAVAATSGNERKLSLYNFPSNTTKAVVEWVALYKGNKPQDWTPAPENQVTNDEFTKRTTEIEKSVEGVKTTVSNVQNSQVGFEKRMSNVEQTASGLSTSVKQLTQTQTTQGKQITDANTKIEQQAQAIKAKVEIKQVEDYVGGFQIPELKNTVTKNARNLMEEISKKVATQDYNKKTTELERLISANAQGISLAAIKTEVYTKGQADGKYADKAYVEKQVGRIDVTEKAITSTVQKGNIISAINQTAEQIQIDVAKLKINADTIVQWLTAKGIDADVIKISGDKVTIDKNGITAKMADFFFEDERGQKFSVTPRKNLIPDHDFSHISFKNFNNYFLKIEYSPTWTIMSNPYIEKPVVNNYEPMVNPLRIDLSNWIRFTLFDGVKPGKKYTLSAHFRATTNDNRVNITNKPIMRAVFGKYNGDTPVELGRASKTYDAPSIQTGKIVRYALTFTVPSNYVEGNGYVYIDLFGEGLLNNMQAIAVSGVQLVEGDVPSVYNWDTTHGELVNGTLPFSTIALGTKDNVIYHNHVNKWNYMNAPLEIISNGEMMALVGDDRAGLSFYPRGGGERRSYIGHIYNNENRFRIESKDPVATTQSIECNGINVCGGYFGANAGSIHYTNGSLGLGWYFHDGRWNYVDFTNMTSRT